MATGSQTQPQVSPTISDVLHLKELTRRADDAQTTKFQRPKEIVRGGHALHIPEDMRPDQAVESVKLWAAAEQKVIAINESIGGIPIDAAHALQKAAAYEFGFTELKKTPGGFFEPDKPPTFIAVPIDHLGNTVDVYVGRMSLPGFEDGWIQTHPDNESMCLWIKGQIRQKDQKLFKQLIDTARRILKAESLYKGKAIKLDLEDIDEKPIVLPTFYDISSPNTILLNRSTEALVEATIWTPIRKAAILRKLGIPVKRGILLSGTYGTGKTLTARETARVAVENGFTFVYMKDVKDIAAGFKFVSQHYLPVVLFCEDGDQAFKDPDVVNDIQNTLDGIDTKHCEVITVLTTNHVDQIPLAIIRPGRVDTLVTFDLPDAETSARLVRHYAGDLLVEDADMVAIGRAVEGNIPAVIGEIVNRAKLFGLGRINDPNELRLTSEDIVLSAQGMAIHMGLLKRGVQVADSPIELLGKAIGTQVAQGIVTAASTSLVTGDAHQKSLVNGAAAH